MASSISISVMENGELAFKNARAYFCCSCFEWTASHSTSLVTTTVIILAMKRTTGLSETPADVFISNRAVTVILNKSTIDNIMY